MPEWLEILLAVVVILWAVWTSYKLWKITKWLNDSLHADYILLKKLLDDFFKGKYTDWPGITHNGHGGDVPPKGEPYP